ncbi:MAG: DUF58 domain-containing protein [Planctomycetota bacterium]|nr:MAG: DUF58 domain-containing protein [Planctomycetota bacterium]
MPSAEQYLKPEVIRSVSRLDLRARFIVEGFLTGLHTSPFQGFSVEFSEHRRYSEGDDPKDIDWLVYAKTDRYYVKKYQAETNITGYLVMDLSESMGFTHRQDLTKFDYSVCLAAALAYLMVHQQDPVGLITFDERIRASLPARSKRTQLANILALLAKAKPTGPTDVAKNLRQTASMLKHKSLIMLFSDLLVEPEPVLQAIRQLRFGGHDVIIFHVLDESEVHFPYDGMLDLLEPESGQNLIVDAQAIKADYLQAIQALRATYKSECRGMGADFVELDTSMRFDHALVKYLSGRKARF